MGCMFEREDIKYEPMAPEYQQDFAKQFTEFLSGQVGRGATPYPGQVAAPFVNPYTRGAYGAMMQSPYGSLMGGMPFVPPAQQPQAQMPGQLGGGQQPRQMPQIDPRQMFQRDPREMRRRGFDFRR